MEEGRYEEFCYFSGGWGCLDGGSDGTIVGDRVGLRTGGSGRGGSRSRSVGGRGSGDGGNGRCGYA